MALKYHNEDVGNTFNQTKKFDRDYEGVAGVSPIKRRHPVDLFGE